MKTIDELLEELDAPKDDKEVVVYGFMPNTFQIFTDYVDTLDYLTPQEFRILIFMTRHIYGYRIHPRHTIPMSMFLGGLTYLKSNGERVKVGGVGMTEKQIAKALNGLKKHGFVKEETFKGETEWTFDDGDES